LLFALIVAYVGGLVTWNDNTPPGEPVMPDVRIAVGEGASYAPATGWTLDAATIKAGEKHGVRHEAAAFRIAAKKWTGSTETPLERAKRAVLSAKELCHADALRPFRTAPALPGTTVGYSGKSIQGRLWAIVDTKDQVAVTIDAHAMPNQFRAVKPDIDAMVASVKLEATP
jgi:hypothetical protein